jgi:antitoxin (DNA-binding transcriptional repressor) of toxin-antitoxin stability system
MFAPVKSISTTELRSKTRALVRSLENGNAIGLTHRGRRLAKIYPVRQANGLKASDPLYQLHRHASKKAKPLSDRSIDRIIYGD